MRIAVLVACVACGHAPPPVANQAPPAVIHPPTPACPSMLLRVWPDEMMHVVMPQCAPEPLRSADYICPGACPRPCRSTRNGEPWSLNYTYDARGRWASTHDERDVRVIKPVYAGDRIVELHNKREGSTLDVMRVTYDAAGRLVSYDPQTKFTWGPHGVTRIDSVGWAELEYDGAGRLIRHRENGHRDAGAGATYRYDDAGYLVERAVDRFGRTFTRTYRYDERRRLSEATDVDNGKTSVTRYRHDAGGRLVTVTAWADDAVVDEVRFDYDCR